VASLAAAYGGGSGRGACCSDLSCLPEEEQLTNRGHGLAACRSYQAKNLCGSAGLQEPLRTIGRGLAIDRPLGNADYRTCRRRATAHCPGENVARTKNDLSLPAADRYAQDTLARIRKNLGVDYLVLGSYFDLGRGSASRLHRGNGRMKIHGRRSFEVFDFGCIRVWFSKSAQSLSSQPSQTEFHKFHPTGLQKFPDSERITTPRHANLNRTGA